MLSAGFHSPAHAAGFVRIVLLAGALMLLAGCTIGSLSSLFPGPTAAAPPRPQDPEPDIVPFVRTHLDTIFSSFAQPKNVSVAPPRREVNSYGWTTCVRANVSSVVGSPIGERIYFIIIENGMILDRRLARPEDGCEREAYRPL